MAIKSQDIGEVMALFTFALYDKIDEGYIWLPYKDAFEIFKIKTGYINESEFSFILDIFTKIENPQIFWDNGNVSFEGLKREKFEKTWGYYRNLPEIKNLK